MNGVIIDPVLLQFLKAEMITHIESIQSQDRVVGAQYIRLGILDLDRYRETYSQAAKWVSLTKRLQNKELGIN